jgi:2'-5' RNA ligase
VRLFVAILPPDPVLDAVAGLRRPERPGVRWTTRAQWHVTLRFLGEVPDPGPVIAALDGARLAPCEARLGPAVAGLGREVVMVPVDGLDVLADAVVTATAGLGRPPEDRPFTGHLTLARVRRGAPRGARRGVVGEAIEARFPVTDVRLVRSHLGRDGARYEDLHVRALAGS